MLANQLEENLVLYGNSVQDGAPTPEASIDIMSVENPTIKVTGENLISPYTLYEGLNNYQEGIDEETGRKYIRFIDNKLKQFNWSFKENTQYTVSAWVKATIKNNDNTQQSHFLYFWYTDGTTSMAKVQRDSDWTFVLHTSTKGKTIQSIGMFTYNYVNYVYVDVDTFMLNEGTEALPYEPYEEELITIDETTPFGTNLFNFDVDLIKAGYPDFGEATLVEKTENGVIVQGKLATVGEPGMSSWYNGWFQPHITKTTNGVYLKKGDTVTISADYTWLDISNYNDTPIYIHLCTQDSTGNNIGKTINKKPTEADIGKTFRVKVTHTNTKGDGYFIPIFTLNSCKIKIENIQISYDNTDFTYKPYVPPITTMRGIGDYKDRIYTKDGKVWFEQRSGLISLKDTNWYNYNTSLSILHSDDFGMKHTWFGQYGLCNIYSVAKQVGFNNMIDNSIALGADNSRAYVKDTINATGQANYREWIQTIDSELVYPLATPIITEITGALAEKILAIDKSKNITIYSDNGVYGNSELIEQ